MYSRVILFLLILISFNNKAQGEKSQLINYQFKHLTIDNGLSHADANAVVQDKRGFIWIGTYSGLNRYDGYETRCYYNELSYINKPYLNRIYDISVDDNGLLWLATSAGIQLFDPHKEKYIPIKIKNEVYRDEVYELEKILTVGSSYVLVKNNEERIIMYKIEKDNTLSREPFHIDARCFSLNKDRDQRVWISTDKGLYVLQENNVLFHFFLPKENDRDVSVRYSLINKDNNLLIATESKLYLYEKNVEELFTDNARELRNGQLLPVDLSKGWITDLIQDYNGDYWVSSLKGLYHIIRKKDSYVSKAIFTGNFNYSLTSDLISRLFLESSGNLFISTYGGGVSILDLNQNPFFLIQKLPFEKNTLSENIVRAIDESEGCLWMGTNSMGLNCIDKKNGEYTYYNNHLAASFSIASDGIRALLNDKAGTLWVGHTNGLDLIDLKTRRVKKIPEIEKTSLGEITSITQDCFNQIWIGTWSKGIVRIRQKEDGGYETLLFKSAKPDYPAFTPARIITVYADSIRPEVLYSSGRQLIHLFLDQKGDVDKSLIYQANDAKTNSLSSNFVCSIAREDDTTLWVGCIGGGLNRMTLLPDGGYDSKVFLDHNGLNQMDIESLQMDNDGNLWLGANGLTKYVPSENQFNYYRTVDGYFVNSFKVGGSYKGEDGWLYFGGIKGVVCFNPANIKKNKLEAKPEISSVYINNRRSLDLENLKLEHNQNNISFHFTGLHYVAPEKCKFRYRLVPFEKEWNMTEDGVHTVNYTNLPYDNYKFELYASNNDGMWSKQHLDFSFKIMPPWWLSWYAKLVYVLLVLCVLFAVYYYLLRWMTLKKQLEIKHINEQHNKRIHEMQLQFFTNISHEFRTPLTLMLGTIEKISTSHSWKQSYEEILMRNVKRLMTLVDEVIDFKKVETDDAKLDIREHDLYAFVEKTVSDFNLLAAAKNLHFNIDIPQSHRMAWFDSEIMEKIILNLLNNAFKYTKEGGTIDLMIDNSDSASLFKHKYEIKSNVEPESCIRIYIRDTGVGISEDFIDKIFTRYYRIQDSDYDPHLGSGVGLALVKSSLLLHKGNLTVSSEREKGTDFLLTFPCEREDYSNEEVCGEKVIIDQEKEHSGEICTISRKEDSDSAENKRSTILLVEDNDEVRGFLVELLNEEYIVLEATDGKDALAVIKRQKPDIIVSDLMMPKMDGNELCRIVKSQPALSSIPFVMLTAKASLDAKIEGTESGVDTYLTKPVSSHLLNSVIRNLLTQKKRVKESVSSTYIKDMFDETIQAKDKDFYDAFLQVVMANISNPGLDVNQIAQEMGYSRTRLYQRVKEITDKPVMELIRQFRLRKAVQIMAEEDLPISEIISKIGIISQSYFTGAFKKEYGILPSQYMKNLKNKP